MTMTMTMQSEPAAAVTAKRITLSNYLPTIFRKRRSDPSSMASATRRPSLFSSSRTRSSSISSRDSARQSQVYEITDRRWYMYTITQPDGEVEMNMVSLPPDVAASLQLDIHAQTPLLAPPSPPPGTMVTPFRRPRESSYSSTTGTIVGFSSSSMIPDSLTGVGACRCC